MAGITIHFDDAGRRSRKRHRGPVVAALIGGAMLGALVTKTPPAPPRIIEKPVIVTQTVAAPAPPPVIVQVPAPAAPVPAPVPRPVPKPAPVRGLEPIRPVLEPPSIVFKAPGEKTAVVFNPGDRPLTINHILILGINGPAVGYTIDSSQCNGKKLAPRGGRCTITITASEEAVKSGSGFRLSVSHDGLDGVKRPVN
jgi:hypothetical protein